jgi:hypothetical protein
MQPVQVFLAPVLRTWRSVYDLSKSLSFSRVSRRCYGASMGGFPAFRSVQLECVYSRPCFQPMQLRAHISSQQMGSWVVAPVFPPLFVTMECSCLLFTFGGRRPNAPSSRRWVLDWRGVLQGVIKELAARAVLTLGSQVHSSHEVISHVRAISKDSFRIEGYCTSSIPQIP